MIEKTNKTSITERETTSLELDELVVPTVINQTIDINTKEILTKEGFSNIKLIGQGWSSTAYNATLDGKDCIIRVPKIGGGGFNEYEREHDILEIVRSKIKSVKLPKTHLFESNGLKYVVHEKIMGNIFNINNFEQLNETKQDNFSQSVANFFNEMHSIDINEVSNISGLRWGSLSTDYIKESFEKYLAFFKNESWEENLNFSKHEIDAFCKFINSISNIKEPEVLLHRDFHGENFVVDNEMHLVGVFDFGNCSIASRVIEFNCFVKKNDDGTFHEPLLLKKLLFFYEKASGVRISFNDIVNQVKYSDAYCITWLVCTDEILNNNKDHLRECVVRIKKWLGRDMGENR